VTRNGMSPGWARAEVLGHTQPLSANRHPGDPVLDGELLFHKAGRRRCGR
jgi:hypothetical protein